MEVAADASADRLHDFPDEPRAVRQHAAVLVGPIVDAGAQKLRNQVAVGAMQFDAVQPRLAGAPRPLRERLYGFFDLRQGHRFALESV